MINKTVLIVERDPVEAEKILRFFRDHKFRNPVEVVHTKAEALEYIFETGKYKNRSNHEAPGMILLDLLTNKTQDVGMLEPLQWYLRTQTIPMIILTSSAEQEKEVGEYRLGAVGFIRKPLDFTHFIEAIQHIGVKWYEQSESKIPKGREKVKDDNSSQPS